MYSANVLKTLGGTHIALGWLDAGAGGRMADGKVSSAFLFDFA